MPSALIPIAWQSLSSTAATVTFNSIPGTYRDLVLVIEGWVTSRTSQILVLNSDTTYTNYYFVYAQGSGTSAISGSGNSYSTNEVFENSSTNRAVMRLQLMDYSATDKHKSVLIRADNANPNGTEMRAMRWANTAAVTSLTMTTTSTTWGANTSFALYGVSA
jgi:hypothetical protein